VLAQARESRLVGRPLLPARTSIVHNQGVATSSVAKCKLIKWFKPGDLIALTPEHMRAIFLALLTYRNELFREQFPEQHIYL
jgi:hypothetical protein